MDTLQCALGARGIGTIRFNRPDKANSYDQAMLDAVGTQLEAWRDDARVRAIVLSGAGKHFSAGAAIGEGGSGEGGRKPRLIIEVCALLDQLPKPTIVVVQGSCIGGAVALACCCDVLIATPEAAFSIPEVRLGFAPGPLIPIFVRALGHRAVRHYLISGERFSGADALRLGLAHKLVDASALGKALDETIESILLGAPGAQARAKEVMQSVAPAPVTMEELMRLQEAFAASARSEEAEEGRASFKEKRRPRWYPD